MVVEYFVNLTSDGHATANVQALTYKRWVPCQMELWSVVLFDEFECVATRQQSAMPIHNVRKTQESEDVMQVERGNHIC